MSGVFHFRCQTPCFPRNGAVLVLFAGPTSYDRNTLTDAVSEESRRALAPEAAYIMYPADLAVEAADDLVANMDVFSALTADATIGVYQYDAVGAVSLVRALQGTPAGDLPIAEIRRQGLTTLFRRHGGALDAGPTAHFVRPSSRPSSRFLRASHALSDGAEIYFAALWLLPHLPDDVEFVHLDTSSIASVLLAALILKQVRVQPTILTFHSYSGLKRHPFSVDRSDLVLISASQSGTMASDLCALVGDSSRILTLFSSADPPGQTKVVCDIRFDEVLNADGFQPPREVGDATKTRPIRLISEHFTVEPEPPRTVVPTVKYVPDVIKNVLPAFIGNKVLIALRATDVADDRSAIWIDMRELARLELFESWVERMVTHRLPATTRALVQIDDDAQSAVLADAIMAAVARHGGRLEGVRRLRLSEVERGTSDWAEPGSPIVVTGATTGRGTQLLAASRALRRFAPASHRIFITPGTIGLSKRGIELLRSNLKQPSYEFETMFELIIDRETLSESWKEERMLLEDLDRGKSPDVVGARIEALSGHAEGRTEGLFLGPPGGELRLRDNFAFWPPETNCARASQADVFATIAALVEHLRTDATPIGLRLMNDVQTHTVLSVETFSRYNDGIIQASFLRAASPIELNYQDTPAESRLMLDLLRQMMRYRDRQQGEALAEFLIAIACGRLRLVDRDMEKLAEEMSAGIEGASEMAVWLADCIVNRRAQLPI